MRSFCSETELKEILDDLVQKGYLKFEHPKKLVKENIGNGIKTFRMPDETKNEGNTVAVPVASRVAETMKNKDGHLTLSSMPNQAAHVKLNNSTKKTFSPMILYSSTSLV